MVSLSRTATRRPDKSSRLVTFPTVPTPPPCGGKRTLQELLAPAPCEYPLPLGHSVEKRTFVRPLSRVPLLAPFPSRPSTPWLHALQSSMCFNHTWRVRHLGPTQSLLKRWVASRSHLLLLSSRFLHPSHINSCCECRSTEPLFLRSLDPQWRLLRVPPPRTLFRRTLPHSRGRFSPQSRVLWP